MSREQFPDPGSSDSDGESDRDPGTDSGGTRTDTEHADIAARVELLERENERLRDQYARTRRASHHRAALSLAAIGVVAALGGIVFPATRGILFGLAGTGLFVAVLTYYLTPERFIAAVVGERVYESTATAGEELVADLGLTDIAVYVPSAGTATESFGGVRLFVPLHRDYVVPDGSELDAPFVVTGDERGRGLSFPPTGASLLRELQLTLDGDLAADPETLVAQLRDALVEEFELVDGVTVEFDEADDRVTVGVRGSAYGPVTRFDHPVASFVATGLAAGLDAPVRVETVETDGSQGEYLVTCDWSDDGV